MPFRMAFHTRIYFTIVRTYEIHYERKPCMPWDRCVLLSYQLYKVICEVSYKPALIKCMVTDDEHTDNPAQSESRQLHCMWDILFRNDR